MFLMNALGAIEHLGHAGDAGCVPARDVLVEGVLLLNIPVISVMREPSTPLSFGFTLSPANM